MVETIEEYDARTDRDFWQRYPNAGRHTCGGRPVRYTLYDGTLVSSRSDNPATDADDLTWERCMGCAWDALLPQYAPSRTTPTVPAPTSAAANEEDDDLDAAFPERAFIPR